MKIDFFAGLDEAGRGPLAGPVSAACVIVPPDFPLELLNDSKKLTEKKRLAAYDVIIDKCLWGYGQVEHDEIDRINILKASLKAMKIAYDDMLTKIGEWCKKNSYDLPSIPEDICAVCDGIFVPEINCSVFSEPKADGKYPCVMAASIIAKVNRDRLMVEKYDRLYPEYLYARHKGYPTPLHKKICRELGPSPIQRLSFNYK